MTRTSISRRRFRILKRMICSSGSKPIVTRLHTTAIGIPSGDISPEADLDAGLLNELDNYKNGYYEEEDYEGEDEDCETQPTEETKPLTEERIQTIFKSHH